MRQMLRPGSWDAPIQACALLNNVILIHILFHLGEEWCSERISQGWSQGTWSYGFPSSHVWMWELDYKESWAPKNWCFWTVVLEKSLESPLDCEAIQAVHPKGNQSWIFIGRTDAEAETPIIWPLGVKNWLIWKDPDARKDWRQEERGTTEDEMVGWHHWLSGHESETALGAGDGQGSLVCCSPWGRKELDMTEWLNWMPEDIYFNFSNEGYMFSSNTSKDTGPGDKTWILNRNEYHPIYFKSECVTLGHTFLVAIFISMFLRV